MGRASICRFTWPVTCRTPKRFSLTRWITQFAQLETPSSLRSSIKSCSPPLSVVQKSALRSGGETLVDAAIFREAITNNSARTMRGRLAHLFCELFYRAKASNLVEGDVFEMPISRHELGETLGMSIATVNRTLEELRASKAVSFQRGQLHVRRGTVWSGLRGSTPRTYTKRNRRLSVSDRQGCVDEVCQFILFCLSEEGYFFVFPAYAFWHVRRAAAAADFRRSPKGGVSTARRRRFLITPVMSGSFRERLSYHRKKRRSDHLIRNCDGADCDAMVAKTQAIGAISSRVPPSGRKQGQKQT